MTAKTRKLGQGIVDRISRTGQSDMTARTGQLVGQECLDMTGQNSWDRIAKTG
jgi:hypothetical protein